MSLLSQPLLIGTANYHVGQGFGIHVAEDKGFFRQEGLAQYVFDRRALVPAPLEREGIALAMEEGGVDIAIAVALGAAVHQRSLGAELYIVGGWRLDGPVQIKWFARKGLTRLEQLRGARIGVRERAFLPTYFLSRALRLAGLDPDKEIEWICDPIYAGDTPDFLDRLRTGKVDVIFTRAPYTELLKQEGFPIVLDPLAMYPGGLPGMVTVATRRTIDERAAELRAFLRAIIRAFWFIRDPGNVEYLRELNGRMQALSHNDFEHERRLVTGARMLEEFNIPMDAGVSRSALDRAIRDMASVGELERALPVDEILRDQFALDAYREVSGRSELREARDRSLATVARLGY